MAASYRALPLLLPLLLVSELCASPRCLENTPAGGCTFQASAGVTEIEPSSASGLGGRGGAPAATLSAEDLAAKQHGTGDSARLRRSGRRRWVAASPVRFRNLNSKSNDATELLENGTRDMATKTVMPHYSTNESQHTTESHLTRGWEPGQTDRPQEKSMNTLRSEDTTLHAIASGYTEADATSVHVLTTLSTNEFTEGTSQRSLGAYGERSASSKQEMVPSSGEDSETAESHITVKPSSLLAFDLQSTSENNSLFRDKSRLLTSITEAISVPSATSSRDGSGIYNKDNEQSRHLVPQGTIKQIPGFVGSEKQQYYSTEGINLEQSRRGDSSSTESPDTDQFIPELVTPPHGWSEAGDTSEQETSIVPPLELSRLPSKRIWKTADFYHQTETTVPTTEFPAVESTSVGGMLDHATSYDIVNSSQMTTQSALEQLQETSAAQTSVSNKWLGATSDSVEPVVIPSQEQNVPLRQFPDTDSESQEVPSIHSPLGQTRIPSNYPRESANVFHSLPQETMDSEAKLSVSTSKVHQYSSTVESSNVIPKATLRQLPGPPDNESKSYTSSESDSIVTPKGEIDTVEEFLKKSHIHEAEEIPSRNWPNFITNSQETSSIEPPPMGLLRLPSKRIWQSVTGQQQPEAVASEIDLPVSTFTTTADGSSHSGFANAPYSNHIIPNATVKQLQGPPESEGQWYPPPKSTGERIKSYESLTEDGVSSNRRLDFGITTGHNFQETSSIRPPMGLSRLPSKRLWFAVNESNPVKSKDAANEPIPVLTNVGADVSHDRTTNTAVSSYTLPKATVKQSHRLPDRETQWYLPSDRFNSGDPREENSSRTKSSQSYSWVPEKKLPSHTGTDFDYATGYERKETSVDRPPSGLSRVPSKRPWESSDLSPSIGSVGSVTKQLLSIEKQAEILLSDRTEQLQLKDKQTVPASPVAPQTKPNFLPLLRAAHLLLEAAQQQAYGSPDAEMQRSTAKETDLVSAAALRESELSRITKQLSFITQLLISGLLLNVLTTRQLQGSSIDSPLLNPTPEEMLGPAVTSLDVPSIQVTTATPDVSSTYPDDYHYNDTMVWNASSETSIGGANGVPFFLRSWVSRPIPVVPLPEGVSDLVGEHPAPDGQPPPPPPEFPSEELDVEESVGGGLATSWHSATTVTSSRPPSYWDTTQSPYNYWNPTTTSTPSPYDYWHQTTNTTQYPYNYWDSGTTTTQPPYNYWNTNQYPYNYWTTKETTTQSPYNYWNTNEATTMSPYNYWDTSTPTTQSPYNYWYTNKDTSQNPYNYWGTTTSTTLSPYNYWYTNQNPHNYWDTTNTTTARPYDYWHTSLTTTSSPYNYWSTATQDPYYWYTTPTTSSTPTKSPYEIWYDYWYGNATTTTKSPYENWYNYWYSKSTTTTKSPYDSWNDYWSKIKTTTTTPTSQPQLQNNWYYGWPTTSSPSTTEPPPTHRPWYDYWSTPTTTTSKPNALSHYNGYYGWQAQTTSRSTEPPTTQRPWYDYWSTTSRPATTQSQNNWFDSWKVPTTTQRPWYDYWSTTSRPQNGQSQNNWYHNWFGTTTTTSNSQPAADFPTTTRSPWHDFWGTKERPSAWYNSWGNAGPSTTATETPPSQAQTTENPGGQQPAGQTHSADVSSSSEKPIAQLSQGTHHNPDGSYVMDVPGHHEEGFYRVPAGGGAPVFVKKGYYTYTDGTGEKHTVSYIADEYGYRTSGA